jgi:hypothetical protein
MFTQLQNSICDILTSSPVQGTDGQVTTSWAVAESSVKTRFSEAPKNITIEDRNYIVTKETFVFFFDASYDSIITKESRILFEGKEYYIVKVSNFKGNKSQHHLEVYCQIFNIGGQSGLQSATSIDLSTLVPKTTRVNGKPLTGDIVVETADIPDLQSDLDSKQNIGTNYDDRNFSQAFNASSVVVNHNFGKYPSVIVIDSGGDEVVGNIVHNSANQLTITFSASFAGTVYCN